MMQDLRTIKEINMLREGRMAAFVKELCHGVLIFRSNDAKTESFCQRNLLRFNDDYIIDLINTTDRGRCPKVRNAKVLD